jgi:hypothetical protein
VDHIEYERYFRLAELMTQYGGGFASAIAEAFFRADQSNADRLVEAFRDLFESFAKFG